VILLQLGLRLFLPFAGSGAASEYGPPPGYYSGAFGKTGVELRDALHRTATCHHRELTDSGTWSVIAQADADSDRAGNVLAWYANAPFPAGMHLGTYAWEREHLWPQSAMPVAETFADSDVHALVAESPSHNRARSNSAFGDCRVNCKDLPATRSVAANRLGGDLWEVWPERRGDVARAMMYMAVRYASLVAACDDGTSVAPNTNFELVDNVPRQLRNGAQYMGRLCDLQAWHLRDRVDERERRRNQVVYVSQGNRNPFVDYPGWTEIVWDFCPQAYKSYDGSALLVPFVRRY
jgi:serine protease